jgi:hypothetical protein
LLPAAQTIVYARFDRVRDYATTITFFRKNGR